MLSAPIMDLDDFGAQKGAAHPTRDEIGYVECTPVSNEPTIVMESILN